MMAAGEARRRRSATGEPCVIVGRDGRPRWSEVWDGNPYILKRPVPRCNRIISGGGVRPYIVEKHSDCWTWKPYKARPAEMFFTPAEIAFAEPYRGHVMVEPNTKDIGHTNKTWIWARWQAVVDNFPVGTFLQCGAPGTRYLDRVKTVATPSFRHALAVLSVCRGFVGTEGGLMHGAAAVDVPAVILWSEFISPDITGYLRHLNIRHAGKACGMRVDCSGCKAAMAAITVEEVTNAVYTGGHGRDSASSRQIHGRGLGVGALWEATEGSRLVLPPPPSLFAVGQAVYLAGSGGPLARADPFLVERVDPGPPARYTLSSICGGHHTEVPGCMLDAYPAPGSKGSK
jgi:hypothetical protein